MRTPTHILRDRVFGRRIGRQGAARILEEAERAPTNNARTARWRSIYAGIPIEHTLSKQPSRK